VFLKGEDDDKRDLCVVGGKWDENEPCRTFSSSFFLLLFLFFFLQVGGKKLHMFTYTQLFLFPCVFSLKRKKTMRLRRRPKPRCGNPMHGIMKIETDLSGFFWKNKIEKKISEEGKKKKPPPTQPIFSVEIVETFGSPSRDIGWGLQMPLGTHNVAGGGG